MATHPTGPKDPARPQKSRHIAARAIKHDARGVAARELMERDCLRVLEWLGAAPLRTITSEGMRAWVKQQEPPWTPGYWRAVQAKVQDAISERTAATGPEIKARLMALVDHLLPSCRGIVLGNGGGTAGTVPIRDPTSAEAVELATLERKRSALQAGLDVSDEPSDAEDLFAGDAKDASPEEWTDADEKRWRYLCDARPYLYEIDHKAVQGYMKIMGQLTGVLSEKHQHVHLHTAVQNGGDLSEVPEAELVEAERIGVPR